VGLVSEVHVWDGRFCVARRPCRRTVAKCDDTSGSARLRQHAAFDRAAGRSQQKQDDKPLRVQEANRRRFATVQPRSTQSRTKGHPKTASRRSGRSWFRCRRRTRLRCQPQGRAAGPRRVVRRRKRLATTQHERAASASGPLPVDSATAPNCGPAYRSTQPSAQLAQE